MSIRTVRVQIRLFNLKLTIGLELLTKGHWLEPHHDRFD